MAGARELIGGLQRLNRAMEPLAPTLDLEHSSEGGSTLSALSQQITDYLIPRLRRLDAPLLVVIGGSTGSGKSTLTNTLIGTNVSPAGVLRPTTRAPVLIHHPDDQEWFGGSDVLPDLVRETGSPTTPTGPRTGDPTIRLVESDGVGPGLAIVDAPDIDSIEVGNRELADQLLAAADMWLFSTTAARYADAVPWDFLNQARERGTALALIVNRVPAGAVNEILPHLKTMLDEAGLPDIDLFPIEHAELTDEKLPEASVKDIRALLENLATDAEARDQVMRKTLDGALDAVTTRADVVVKSAEEQYGAIQLLRAEVGRGYGDSLEALADDISSGTMLRSEVLERWQELVGAAELMQAVQSRVSMIRDRIGRYITGRPGQTTDVQGEITSTLEMLLIDRADDAAATVASAWRTLPGGREALKDDRALERSSKAFKQSVGSEIRAWQTDILDLVKERGAGKRNTARVLALGINSIGVALMLVIFAQTGGVTGGELAVGAGAAGISQTLLSAIFGEQAVRELAIEARDLLITRIGTALEADADRFRWRLDEFAAPEDSIKEFRSALDQLEMGK